MENTKDEFITKAREHKPPYTLSTRADGTKIITIDRSRKLSPADKEEIEMLVKVGYIPVRKKKDITKASMLKYVKENYDQEEQDLLNKQLDSINSVSETGTLITFATIKSWFRQRYIYYPKGINWNFGNTKTAQEKKERFLKVFAEHKEDLKSAGSSSQAPLDASKGDTKQEPPQEDNKRNKK